jgi:adenine-specific DNA-methyltransferase
LKKIKKTASVKMTLKPAEFKVIENWIYKVYNSDVNKLVKNTKHDVVYLDPPYNHRQYSGNYHLLETIAKYDNPQIFWKTWTRDNKENKSDFCSRVKVKKAFEELINNIDANYIFVSYNDEWLLSLEDMKEIMSKRWDYWVITKEYKRYKADKTENRNHKKDMVYEYLHYVIINKD